MAERNCKKCFHYKACKEVASHNGYADINYTESQCKNFILTADVAEVKHGYIIEHQGNEDDYYCQCSVCKTHEVSLGDKYCSECGAKMDGGAE